MVFADVVGFTPLAEAREAEQIVGLLNELFSVLTEIVFRHGGTVDKFIGDCIMAVWGAPVPQEDHAARALGAAEDMMRFLETANEGWKREVRRRDPPRHRRQLRRGASSATSGPTSAWSTP